MASTPNFGSLNAEGTPAAPETKTPFRILVVGDFCGRTEAAGADDIAGRRPTKVERDGFDELPASMGVNVTLSDVQGDEITLPIENFEALHPDEIFKQIAKFEDLDGAKKQSALMNAILHHPRFKTVEASWRGLDWLVRRATGDDLLEVHALDLPWAELEADLRANDDLANSGLYRNLTDPPAGKPFAVVIGLYSFDLTVDHAELLGRLARIARATYAPFCTAAAARILDPALKPPADQANAWEELRQLPASAFVAVAGPNFLLRPPFGSDTKPVEAFDFEEMTKPGKIDEYLWGNAGLACGAALAMAFKGTGWGIKPGASVDLENMTMHAYSDEDGDPAATVAEVSLTTQASQKLGKLGLTCLLAVKGRDMMQIAKLRPLEQTTPKLCGLWDLGAGVAKAAGTKKAPIRSGMTTSTTYKPESAPDAAKTFSESPRSSPSASAIPQAQSFSEMAASGGGSGGGGSSSSPSYEPNHPSQYVDNTPGNAGESEFWRMQREFASGKYRPVPKEEPSSDFGSSDFSSETPAEETPSFDSFSSDLSTETPTDDGLAGLGETPPDDGLAGLGEMPTEETPAEETPAEEPAP